ncbi:MAG TPA: polysaccharide deacetylase family protein [Spirochaetota bacterium]|nr:polysaccharide deacetylase family protein [Spirochaetota bacterium]HPN12112.1 polysaccharide deacetylase family protein [Spirochaetota bacterium]
MKSIHILTGSLLVSLLIAIFLFIDDSDMTAMGRMSWVHKNRETATRLLAIPVLLYHNIDGKGPFSIDAATLREHFQLIRDRGIRVIPLRELIHRLENPVPYREKVIVITFDDGYGSMSSKLLPLVKEFGYPVTLFVYVDMISLRSSKNLTWKKLRGMDRQGIDIQAHSMSHKDLVKLSKSKDPGDRRSLYEELYLSKRVQELYLNKNIDYYAFPFGRYDLTIIDLAANSGYRRVFSTDYGSNIITRDNYCLRRQHIKSSYSLNYIDNIIR